MNRRAWSAVLFSTALAVLTSCGRPVMLPATPSGNYMAPQAGLHAGAAEADITPPPGLALFGHGPEGRISRGVRLRLRCQAFVLASGSESIALIPCDLAAPSLELQRAIAQKVRAKGAPLGADRIVLFATHTHAGPAHYFGPRRYSGTFSSRQPGFDEDVLEFLADRIAGAVVSAYKGLQPACGAWDQQAVFGLSRNRSLRAHVRNTEEATALIESPSSPIPTRDLPRPTVTRPTVPARPSDECVELRRERLRVLNPAQFAVDPALSVLRLDARRDDVCDRSAPIGVFAVFGVHNTAIANTNDLYHGDVFGYATRALERSIERQVVVGMANGVEGDVSPDWEEQSPREARRIGERLARHMKCGYDRAEASLTGDLEIARAYRDLEWPGASTGEPSCASLCSTAELGTPAAGGAEDGPTRFRIVPAFNEGARLEERGESCHGVRVPLLGPGGGASDDGIQFPRLAPIVAAKIGGHMLVAAPAELTTTTGARIRAAVTQRTGMPTVVSGLANAYLQYVTTRPEYQQQDYEGASTLYGECTEYFLTNHLANLAGFLVDGSERKDLGAQPAINVAQRIPFAPSPRVSRFTPLTNELERGYQASISLEEKSVEGFYAAEVSVRGIPPALLQSRASFSVELMGRTRTPNVSDRVVDDDRGAYFVLRFDTQRDEWKIRWEPDKGAPGCDSEEVYIRINGPAQVRTRSFKPRCGRFPEKLP